MTLTVYVYRVNMCMHTYTYAENEKGCHDGNKIINTQIKSVLASNS